MKTNKKLLSLIALSLLLAKPYNVFAASADSFRTDEYKAMGENVLDLINAAGAYAQGYTGKGVTVGVTDVGIVNFSHTEFSGKTGSGVVFDGLESTEVPLTWAELMHPQVLLRQIKTVLACTALLMMPILPAVRQ